MRAGLTAYADSRNIKGLKPAYCEAEAEQYQVEFPNLKVLEFNFTSIQLNRLNWRDFLQQQNPVAAALMVSPVLKAGFPP